MLDVVWGMLENEISVGLLRGKINDFKCSIHSLEPTFGKQSLSKTKACRSCPVLSGINIQLPHHHGLSLNQPSFSSALYKKSAACAAT